MSAFDAFYDLSNFVNLQSEAISDICDAIIDQTDCEDDKRLAALLAYYVYNVGSASALDVEKSGSTFTVHSEEYLVLTDEEADKACAENIKDSVWAFSSDFLASETGTYANVFKALSELHERGNNAILSLIEGSCGIDKFIEDAIAADGRGHFLASYDGKENEYKGYFIYRVN
jgi:hypothetical protein